MELALSGCPTKTHVINVLHRLTDGKPAATRRSGAALADRIGSRMLTSNAMTPFARHKEPPCVMIPQVLPSSSCCAA